MLLQDAVQHEVRRVGGRQGVEVQALVDLR